MQKNDVVEKSPLLDVVGQFLEFLGPQRREQQAGGMTLVAVGGHFCPQGISEADCSPSQVDRPLAPYVSNRSTIIFPVRHHPRRSFLYGTKQGLLSCTDAKDGDSSCTAPSTVFFPVWHQAGTSFLVRH